MIATIKTSVFSFADRFNQLRASSVWVRRFSALAQVWTLIALFVFFSLASDSFLRPINVRNILTQVSTLGIFASGMTFVLLLGQIDLSIASVAALSAMISAHLYFQKGYAEPVPLLAGIGAATHRGRMLGKIHRRLGDTRDGFQRVLDRGHAPRAAHAGDGKTVSTHLSRYGCRHGWNKSCTRFRSW